MDWEAEASKALGRIEELEKKVKALESRMDNQFDATQDINRRVSKLERESRPLNGGTF